MQNSKVSNARPKEIIVGRNSQASFHLVLNKNLLRKVSTTNMCADLLLYDQNTLG